MAGSPKKRARRERLGLQRQAKESRRLPDGSLLPIPADDPIMRIHFKVSTDPNGTKRVWLESSGLTKACELVGDLSTPIQRQRNSILIIRAAWQKGDLKAAMEAQKEARMEAQVDRIYQLHLKAEERRRLAGSRPPPQPHQNFVFVGGLAQREEQLRPRIANARATIEETTGTEHNEPIELPETTQDE